MRGCHLVPLPFSAKIDLNLLIRESTVPWARRKGHWQGACLWQTGWWTRVRPPRSFHTRNATTSVSRAVTIDLGEDRLNKKLDSSCLRALFLSDSSRTGAVEQAALRVQRWHFPEQPLSLTVALLHYLELFSVYNHIADRTWTSRRLHTNTKGGPPREWRV